MGFRKDYNLESVNIETTKKSQKIDRVVLDLESIASIQPLQQQVNEQLGDLVQISLKDIINFILQERAFSLNEDELNKLKEKHFDLVKALRKATLEVIKAKQNGSEIQLDDVLKIIQTPGVISNVPVKKTRGRKKKENGEPATNNKNTPLDDDVKAFQESETKPLENNKSESKNELPKLNRQPDKP